MCDRIMPVDTSRCLGRMAVMVWHFMSLEVVVSVFVDWVMLMVLLFGFFLRFLSRRILSFGSFGCLSLFGSIVDTILESSFVAVFVIV